MKDAPLLSLMSASCLSGICWPSGVPTSRFPIWCGAAAKLRLHAHHKVKQFFSLDDLGCGLAAHRSLDHRFDIGDIDAVARDLFAINIDQQAGLSKLAHHREFGEARHVLQATFLICSALS